MTPEMIITAVIVAAGFMTYIVREKRRARALERKVTFALMRIGNLYAAAGMKERYTEELMRLLLAVDSRKTPQFQDIIP